MRVRACLMLVVFLLAGLPAGTGNAQTETERFVGLWVPRLADRDWMQRYLSAEEVPAEIRGEGFHELPDAVQARLTAALYDRASRTVPALRTVGLDADAIAQQRAILHLAIFGKGGTEQAAPAPLASPQPSRMERKLRAMRKIVPVDGPATSPVAPRPVASEHAVGSPSATLEDQAPPALVAPPALPSLSDGMYQGCVEVAAGPSCSAPVPLGTPLPLDATGDGVPDVLVSLGPSVTVVPNTRDPLRTIAGASFTFSVTKVNRTASLAAHVFARWRIPGIVNSPAVGFDGRAAGLAFRSEVAVVPKLDVLLAGNLGFALAVTHAEPTSEQTLTYAMWDAGFTRFLGKASMTPPPATVTLDAVIARSGPRIDVVAHAEGSAPYMLVLTGADTDYPVPRLRTLTTTVANVPRFVDVIFTDDGTGAKRVYYRADAPITSVDAVYELLDANAGRTDRLTAGIRQLPTTVDVLLDMKAKKLEWVADGPVQAAAVDARNVEAEGRLWDAHVEVNGIPARWDVTFPEGHVTFRGISSAVTSVDGWVTNRGAVTRLFGNHVAARYRGDTGELDASFLMTDISHVEFQKTGSGFRTDLRMGGGQGFAFRGDIVVPGPAGDTAAFVDGSISNLPTRIQVTQDGDAFTYDADANFNLFIDAVAGHPAGMWSAPLPPIVHGLSIRDGLGCNATACGTGVRARFNLSGFPTYLAFDPTPPNPATDPLVVVRGFRPALPQLVVDAELDDVTAPMRVLAVQHGVPSGIDITVGPVTTGTLVGGARSTRAVYAATAPMGKLEIDVRRASDVSRMVVSNIPSGVSPPAFDATATFGPELSGVSVRLGQPISSVEAFHGTVGGARWQAFASLRDVPTSMDLSFGRVADGSGTVVPGFDYTANASTLDGSAAVFADLFNNNLQVQAWAAFDNLGARTRGFLDGGRLRLTSSPPTSRLEAHAWGTWRHSGSASGCLPTNCPGVRIVFSGSDNVVLTADDLHVIATDISDITITPSFASAIQGTYGSFTFGLGGLAIAASGSASLDVCIAVCGTVVSGSMSVNGRIGVRWHLGTHHFGPWIDVPCAQVRANPHPHFTSDNAFTVTAASAENGAWFASPNPGAIVPAPVIELIAALTNPLGGGLLPVFCI